MFLVVGSRCRIAFDALLAQVLQASMIELSKCARSLSACDERVGYSYSAQLLEIGAYR